MRDRELVGHATIVWQRGSERVVLRHSKITPMEEPGAAASQLWVETKSRDDVDAMGEQRWSAILPDGSARTRDAILAKAVESLVAQVQRMARPGPGSERAATEAEREDMEDAVRDARRSPETMETPPPGACFTCGGSGGVRLLGLPDPGLPGSQDSNRTCSACGGSGEELPF